MEALVAASASSSCAPVRPRRFSSFVSGTLGVGGLGVQVPALMFFAPALVVGRCFSDAVELPRWHDLLLQNVAIFDLDFDAILAAVYALAYSAEGDCYLSVLPDPGIAAAALGASAAATLGASASTAPGAGASATPGASASTLFGTAPTESLHTFTLDFGASRSFFRDSTTLTPLSRLVAVSLADPSGGPVLAHSSTVLPCPAAPSGLLSGLHLPSFSTNLVSGADLQDAWVDQFTPGGQRMTHCTCSRTGRHLATFTRRPGSSLYTLTTAPPPVPASGQVATSSQVFAAASRSSPASAPCSCRPLAHETLLWHHRLGHPSLPRLRGMASRALPASMDRVTSPTVLTFDAEGRAVDFDVWVDDLQLFLQCAAGAGAAGGTGAGGAAGVIAGDPGAEGTGAVSAVSGGAARPRPYYVPLLQQPASPLRGPSPSSGPTRGLTECRELESLSASPEYRPASPESRPESPVRTGRRRVPLPSPPASSLPDGPDPKSDSLRAASPTVTRFLATAVTDPSFESTASYALVAELVDFAAACYLDYAASLVAESECVCPPSVGGECALGTDVLEDRQKEFECFLAALPHLVSMLLAPEGDLDAPDIPTPRSYAEAIEGPYSSQWQAAMDTEMASWKSTGSYVDEVPPTGANIVSGMWIFRVKRPPGSPPVFKARYVARGFSKRQGVDFFQTFSPTPKMTTLRVLLHVAAQRDYEPNSLDFSITFLQGSLHEEIWLRRPPGFTGLFPASTQWSLRQPVYSLRQAPREWHDTLRTTLAALGFAPSTADPSLFLLTDTTLPPFYVLVYVDDLVFATADTEALAHVKSELQKRHTCTDLGELTSYLGLRITRDRAQRTITLTQSHMVQQVLQRFGFTYSSPQSTPLPTGHSLSAPPSDESVEPSGPYPELVGCLMCLMTCTRPDLAYPFSILARYVAPGRHRKEHMDAAKRVLRYLCSTSGMGLELGGCARVVRCTADAGTQLHWFSAALWGRGEGGRGWEEGREGGGEVRGGEGRGGEGRGRGGEGRGGGEVGSMRW
ncbi:unnamed protein product [Closterium sp. NIES-54]